MYGIIVCTKCRMHTQIIQVGTSRTVQCQRCGARLEVRKLQLISTSEDRDEVVKARTLIQAKIQANGPVHATHAHSLHYNISQKHNCVNDMHLSVPADSRKIRSRDPVTMILENISDQGEMSIEELKEKCTVLGIDRDVFEKLITMLLDAGEIYSPAKGKIKKV
jgi:DNA-directed RNA polymerase subunit RPC12/RpoP